MQYQDKKNSREILLSLYKTLFEFFLKKSSFIKFTTVLQQVTWDKSFKNGPNRICERQSLKNLKRYGLL